MGAAWLNATALLIADEGNFRIRLLSGGNLSTFAGNGVNAIANGANASFKMVTSVATDGASGIFIVADSCIIRVIWPNMSVGTLAGTGVCGVVDGPAATALVGSPVSAMFVVVDPSLRVWFGDFTRLRLVANGLVSIVAGPASGNSVRATVDGIGTSAAFFGITGLALVSASPVVLAVADTFAVRLFSAATATVSTLAGTGAAGAQPYDDGFARGATFAPTGAAGGTAFALDAANARLIIADSAAQRVRALSLNQSVNVVTTLAGSMSGLAASVDGLGTNAAFNMSARVGVALDACGNIFVSDAGARSIRMIAPGGAVSTVLGGNGAAGSFDGSGADATFVEPAGLAIEPENGTLFIVDAGARRVRMAGPLCGAPPSAASATASASALGSPLRHG